MLRMWKLPLLGLLCGLASGCGYVPTPTTVPTASNTEVNRTAEPPLNAPTTDPTNSGVNVRDRDSTAKTPLDQNENKADIAITADIRKQVVDASLSITAQNVKIITQDRKVTLRGPVMNLAEKQRIEEIAATVAGADMVDSQLEISTE